MSDPVPPAPEEQEEPEPVDRDPAPVDVPQREFVTRRRRQRFDVAGGRIVTSLVLSVVLVLSALVGLASGQTPPANPGGTIEYYHLDALALRHGDGALPIGAGSGRP